MRRMMIAPVVLLATSGCVAKTAWNVVTLPVKAAGAGVDAVTTSPSERDAKYVREQRKRSEREAKERAEYDKQCRKHPDTCGPYTGFVDDPYRDQ